jgi:hypothetical protein
MSVGSVFTDRKIPASVGSIPTLPEDNLFAAENLLLTYFFVRLLKIVKDNGFI